MWRDISDLVDNYSDFQEKSMQFAVSIVPVRL